MTNPLGNWTVIDIETTGIDPIYDQIIDVGFLQFEGTKLVKKYSSLVKYTDGLSQFIQKLTGITDKMVKRAPQWAQVEPEIMELYGSHLIAHNADFERSFLSPHFDELDDGDEPRETYEDSLYYLGLLYPQMSSLKLENFIVEWGLADSEVHRGLEDSVDLLKVLLIATLHVNRDADKCLYLDQLFKNNGMTDWWYYHFFSMEESELLDIGEEIEFYPRDFLENVDRWLHEKDEIQMDDLTPNFDMEFSGENIKKIYDSEVIKEKFPGFQKRDSQVELSMRAGQAFKNHVHALVQAPTGTGKTLGYLIPSALFSMSEEKQVLISTGTKALQQQAMSKDVPQLRKLMGLPSGTLRVKRLVGSGNHLCELLHREEQKEDLLLDTRSFEERFTNMYFDMVFFHNSRADYENKILRSDLPFVFKMKQKHFQNKERDIQVDFRSCTGNKCPFKNECSYITGLREAKDAHIIVGNHALMFSWPKGFPRPAHVVVDEAHKIEEETTRAYSYELSKDMMDSLMKNLQHMTGIGSLFYLLAQNEETEGESTPKINSIREEIHRTQSMLQDHTLVLNDFIERYFKKVSRNYSDMYWNELPMIKRDGPNDDLGISILNHLESIKNITCALFDYLLPYSLMFENREGVNDDNQIIAMTRFETFMGSLEDIKMALEVSIENKPGLTHSLRYHEKDGYLLNSAPINVGRVLHDTLLETAASVLFTSATLGNAKGDQGVRGVEWMTGYSYLEPERRFKNGFFLPSTYDYENKTRVYLCDDTLPFYDANFVPKTLNKIIPLIKNIGGRSLLLFSARTRFETAREILLEKLNGEIPVFVQGMGNNVVEEFKNSGSGVLLGMETFGEGIDIPGDALQFVFIDKIPDLRRELVINDRQDFYDANLGNAFTDYYLSHRTRSLHQKLGRLLRTENDHGGVIIVDSRVSRWKGRTMEKLIKLMEPYKLRRTSLDEAVAGVENFILNHEQQDQQDQLSL